MSDRMYKEGLIHGRFQPVHNGHVRYFLLGLQEAEHLTIGICTPKLCTKEEAARTGFPCTKELNPYTFEERKEMIRLALTENGIDPARYTCIDFPSDYVNVENIVPKGTVFFLSVTSDGDLAKKKHLESLGYETKTLIELTDETREEQGGLIRESIAMGGETWAKHVPKSVADYLANHGTI